MSASVSTKMFRSQSLTPEDAMYDLVLKGGTVIDPSAGLDGRQDIAVQGGVIARIAPDIASAEARGPSTSRARPSRPGSSTCTPTSSRASIRRA